jgi:NitT/TauT family transport system permease protein
MSLFKLRGKLTRTQNLGLGLAGFLVLVLVWWLLAERLSVQRPILEDFDTNLPSSILDDPDAPQIDRDSLAKADSLKFANATEFEKVYPLLPPPNKVVQAFPTLYSEDEVVSNTLLSVWRNIQGYFWAIFLSIPIGFLIGLLPMFRGLFSKQVDAMRYLPLTALTGLFIVWFGIEEKMKVAFLAFGIIVYLLPVVVQRIDEVKDVYLKTVFTLGANSWQTVRTVYIPSVLAKLMDDIRVLTAISWTYIIIAELLNRQGGLGALIWFKTKQGQLEKVFGILIIIIAIGFLQDRIFVYLDRRLFPHKYYKTSVSGIMEVEYGIFSILGVLTLFILLTAFFSTLPGFVTSLAWIVVIAALIIVIYGEFKFRRALTD